MPIPFLFSVANDGLPFGISIWSVVQVTVVVGFIVAVKLYCSGATNKAERKMHSKVVMITGGTTGIGAAVALELAKAGAQIILLTHHEPSDLFLVEHVDDLRTRSGSELIYAEQVDLSSTHSIRKFATKWIDNAPPRRLDMIILCAATLTTPGRPPKLTDEGLEETWMVNYLANFHLLSILSPAIRNQPPDRDVRVVLATCPSYIASPPLQAADEAESSASSPRRNWSPARAYARSKLALMTFGWAFQKHLDAHKRPDGMPSNTRVIFVDPGYARTPGMRRWLTRGSLWGLALYLALWHQAWLWLKSADAGAQSFLHAAMDVTLGRGAGGRLIKECREVDFARPDVRDDAAAKVLWEGSERLVERVEKEQAAKRASAKKQREAVAEKEKEKAKEKKEQAKAPSASSAEPTNGGPKEGKKSRPRRGNKKAAQ
ncbi:MAG: hypothetical protein M1818_001240 [Claussenomyces sp. TS43310]|nr:MAG: hypothetical protein M1818_001240 [Claussenomyces sp. TS43310]